MGRILSRAAMPGSASRYFDSQVNTARVVRHHAISLIDYLPEYFFIVSQTEGRCKRKLRGGCYLS